MYLLWTQRLTFVLDVLRFLSFLKESLRMEVKKKTFLENLRLKTKMLNLKKPRKKTTPKQEKKLKYRRSISVPDLRFTGTEALSLESASSSNASDAIFFTNSPRLSDTDSIVSGSNNDGLALTENLSEPDLETRSEAQKDPATAALARMSVPVEILRLYEKTEDMVHSEAQNEMNSADRLYAQVNRRPKGITPRFNYDPIPAPRSVFSHPVALSPLPDVVDDGSFYGEESDKAHSGALSAALTNRRWSADPDNLYTEKSSSSGEQKKSSSEKGTLPRINVTPADSLSPQLDTVGVPPESADGTSLDSACDTNNDDQINMLWTMDSEELEGEPGFPLFTRDFLMGESLEESQPAEALEGIAEVSSSITLSYFTKSRGSKDFFHTVRFSNG